MFVKHRAPRLGETRLIPTNKINFWTETKQRTVVFKSEIQPPTMWVNYRFGTGITWVFIVCKGFSWITFKINAEITEVLCWETKVQDNRKTAISSLLGLNLGRTILLALTLEPKQPKGWYTGWALGFGIPSKVAFQVRDGFGAATYRTVITQISGGSAMTAAVVKYPGSPDSVEWQTEGDETVKICFSRYLPLYPNM